MLLHSEVWMAGVNLIRKVGWLAFARGRSAAPLTLLMNASRAGSISWKLEKSILHE